MGFLLLPFIVAAAFIAFAAFLKRVGENQLARVKRMAEEGVNTMGTVVRIQREVTTSTNDDGTIDETVNYYPVVRFTDQAGQAHEFKSTRSSERFQPQQALSVRYVPADPAHYAELEEVATSKASARLVQVFAVCFLFAGVASVVIGVLQLTHHH